MAGLHYYIEKRNGNVGESALRECPVIVSFSYSSFRVKAYTGRKVRDQEWDKSHERVSSLYAHAAQFNSYLDQLEERINTYFLEIKSGGQIPDPLGFQIELRKMVKSDNPSFFTLLISFIDGNNKQWTTSTYKKIKTFYSQLKEFSIHLGMEMHPGVVNQAFADKLIIYFRGKGLKDISIKKNLDLLKWFMNWGLKEGLVFNRDYQLIRFTPEVSNSGNKETFLKWEELISLYEFSGLTRKEEWSRDIFCFIVFTGIRFSGISKLRKESLNGRYISRGNSGQQKILLNRFSLELCRKYENKYYRNNTFFPSMSLITFHKHLQSAAGKSGLNRSSYSQSTDAKPLPLYKQVSAQTAINTYYANALKLDNTFMLNAAVNNNSSKSRIMALSGALKLAEEKQILTSDKLYESIRSSGAGLK